MTTKKITLEVDKVRLFDTLHELKGDTTQLGLRLVTILLDDRADFRTELGLAVYGISVSRED